MTTLQLYTLTMMEYVTWTFLILGTLGAGIRKYWKSVLIYAPIFLLIEASKMILPEVFSIVLLYISLVFFVKIVFKKNYLTSVALCVFTYSLIFATQSILTGLLSILVYEMHFIFIYGFIIMAAAIIIVILLYLYAPLYRVMEALDEKKELLYILSVISISFLSIMYHLKLTTEGVAYSHNYAIFVICVALIFISYYIIKIVLEVIEKNEAIRRYETFKNMSAEYTGQCVHSKSLEPIYSLAMIGDHEQSLNHISAYLNNFDGNDALMLLERKPLAMYLYVKMNQLKEAGVSCRLQISDYQIKHKIEDYKLIKVIEILVSNAWEAIDENGYDDKKICINILKKSNEKTIIEVVNKFDEILPKDCYDNFYEKGYSTKEGKKGVGLYQLNKLSEENDFIIIFENRKISDENHVCFALEFSSGL